MPVEVRLLKVGMTMTEGSVEEWFIADGDEVQKGEMLYRLETEKVNMDVDADASGTVKHRVAAGTELGPGEVIGFVFAPDETIPDVLPTPTPLPGEAPVEEKKAPQPAAAAPAPATRRAAGQRLAASPAARRLAAELGVDLADVEGTGPRGRITEGDVTAQATKAKIQDQPRRRQPSSPAARRLAGELGVDIDALDGTGPGGRITREDVERAAEAQEQAPASEPLRGMRRTIAERMFASLRDTAQLTIEMEVDMEDVVKLRTQLVAEWESEGVRPSYTDIMMLAAAKALLKHPRMHSTLADDAILRHEEVHMGMAVALEEGLVVPVIRNTDSKDLKTIAGESRELAERARSGTLGLDDMSGGTFTVTSLGMYGVDTFTPILNTPQSGILGVGRIYDGVAWHGDTPVPRKRLRLSLTWDHRVLDGAPAAEFLAEVRGYLEAPYRLLV
jgi:pyruvate dehydrogenase E2 component (dihydrolipoamide acetyltransferase)